MTQIQWDTGMWIPLRRKVHKHDDHGKEVGAIVDRYPGDSGSAELEFLRERNLKKSLAFVLPLLKHLQIIEHVGNETFPGFAIKVESENNIRLDHKSPELNISGRVLGSNASELMVKFTGTQTLPGIDHPISANFEKIRSMEYWPKSFLLNEQGHFEDVREKSRAEASVVLQSIDNDVGRLSLHWAVFLPMEEETNTYETQIPGTAHHYRFVLHGQFFVDAGRRGISGYGKLADSPNSGEMNETALAVTWNQSVAQILVLPNLLKVMSNHINQTRLSDKDITILTRALQSAKSQSGQLFFIKYRSFICQYQSWACVMLPEGRKWKLVDRTTDRRLLPLPKAPSNDPQRPWKVLPGLSSLRDVVFYDAEEPRLSLDNSTWAESDLRCALNIPEKTDLLKTFGTPMGLDYLSNFLSQEEGRYVSVSAIQDALFNLLRRVFKVIPLSDIRKNREKIRSVVRFLHNNRRIAIGSNDPAAKNAIPSKILSELFIIDSAVLLLPADLDPSNTNRSDVTPSDEDISAWLECVNRLVTNESANHSIERLLDTAQYLLELCANEDKRAALLRINRDLRVIRAVCPKERKDVATSLETLSKLHQHGNLFLFSSGMNLQERLGLVPLISRVVPEEKFLVINSATGRILQEYSTGNILQSGSQSDALRCVGHKGIAKSLGSENDRLALIKVTHAGMGKDSEARRGLRYLLHGSAENFDDDSPLWIEPSHQRSPWVKTWKMVDKARWNVLSGTLANAIPPSQWDDIGIKAVEPSTVIKQLEQVDDLSIIDPQEFSDDERNVILGFIDDKKLWLSMPLHRDTYGNFGSIVEGCYLHTDHRVPSELKNRCRIIGASDDFAHRDKQKRFLRQFDVNAIIQIALSLDSPVSLWELILDEISRDDMVTLDQALKNKLKSVKWIPLQKGGGVHSQNMASGHLADMIEKYPERSYILFF